jgi:hypothetical protein
MTTYEEIYMYTHLLVFQIFNYLRPWRHIAIVISIKRLRSDETTVSIDRFCTMLLRPRSDQKRVGEMENTGWNNFIKRYE